LSEKYRRRDFYKDYEKIVGDDADPVMPEAMAKVVKAPPRDIELIDTLKSSPALDRCRHAKSRRFESFGA
jgi:hypothetical protein